MHRRLLFLLISYTWLAWLNSTTVPLSKAPDEYVHFLYGRFIAEHGRLPLTPEERQGAGYKADQPPLYYGLLALPMRWLDLTPPPKLKMVWDSPRRYLIDLVLPRAMIVRTTDETWPYRGEILAWMLGRWLSILLGNLTLILVYVITLEMFPQRYTLAVSAAAVLAFMPCFTFISAVLSDENLLGLVITLYFWGLVRLIKSPVWSTRYGLGLGVLIGLAILTKYSAIVLPLEFLLVLIVRNWRLGIRNQELCRNLKASFEIPNPQFLIPLTLACILVVSSWLAFQTYHFNRIAELGWWAGTIQPLIAGDQTEAGSTTFFMASVLSGTASEESTAPSQSNSEGSFLDWGRTFFTRCWYIEVYGQPPLYSLTFLIFLTVVMCGAMLVGWLKIWRANGTRERSWLGLLILHGAVFMLIPVARYAITGRIYDTAQARYLIFSGAPSVGILFAWGIAELRPTNTVSLKILVSIIFALSLLQWHHFRTAFPAPLTVRTADFQSFQNFGSLDRFGKTIQLLDSNIALPDQETLQVTLTWQALDLLPEDYLTEISLSQNGTIKRRWLSQPVNGRYPTRAWDKYDIVKDTLSIPLTGLVAGNYQVQLRLLGWDKPLNSEPVPLGEVTFTLEGTVRKPYRFLETYKVLETEANGDTLHFDLFGKPYRFLETYKVLETQSANLPTYRYRATIPIVVSPPPAGSKWRLKLIGADGQAHAPDDALDQFSLFMVNHLWSSGHYRLRAELWNGETMTAAGESGDLLQIANRQWQFSAPAITQRVEANFAHDVQLLGYDLPRRRSSPGGGVEVTLYWQALRQTRHDYIIFDHVLDVTQKTWGGYDRWPRENYPTSLWVPGEVVVDGFIVPIAPDAPPGIYWLDVGLYLKQGQQAQPLSLVKDGQSIQANSVTMGPLKIGGAPVGATVTQFSPQYPRHDILGQPGIISLQGYDVARQADALRLTLYWRNEAQTQFNYTTFVHLQNSSGQTIAQKDGPPGGGIYPTSLWEVGEVVADPVLIPLPSKSGLTNFHFIVGLYRGDTGERLGVVELKF